MLGIMCDVDIETDALLRRTRDLLTANAAWGYVLDIGRAGLPITPITIHDVSEGVRLGDLPDLSLMVPSDRPWVSGGVAQLFAG